MENAKKRFATNARQNGTRINLAKKIKNKFIKNGALLEVLWNVQSVQLILRKMKAVLIWHVKDASTIFAGYAA